MFLEETALPYRITGGHRPRRLVQARVPGDLAKQPDSGDR